MYLEELNLAVLGQTLPSTPNLGKYLPAASCGRGSRGRARLMPAPARVTTSDGEDPGWHRLTGLRSLTQGAMHTAKSSGNTKNLNSQTSWREEKAARKSSSN